MAAPRFYFIFLHNEILLYYFQKALILYNCNIGKAYFIKWAIIALFKCPQAKEKLIFRKSKAFQQR